MRVLVTGGLGYVGRVLVARLAAAEHEVTVLARTAPGPGRTLPDGVAFVQADLLDRDRLREVVSGEGFAGVCHLAGMTRARVSFSDPVGTYATNVGGTVGLLEALAGDDPVRLVFASTAAVYWAGAPMPVDERAPAAPASPYAASKLAVEQLLSFHAATGAIGAISLRCFNVAGAVEDHADPDSTRLIPRALAVAAGRAPRLEVNGDGSAVREYVHVADVAAAYELALAAAQPGRHETLNVGSGTGVPVRDVIATVARVTGRPVATVQVPPQKEPQALVADCGLIRERLGWSPVRSSMDRIVRDAWAAVASR
jgi:UDP-glucose 4-epimerase